MSGNVVRRRGRVPVHEQFAGNIYKAHWADDDEQQVPEAGDSPWVAGVEFILPPFLQGAR